MEKEQPLPRLFIYQISMQNFKSYYGKNFSVIVGENGTGKSNVFDAIMFALGRSHSELRIKKLTDIINRSKNVKDSRVSLIFDFKENSGGHQDEEEDPRSCELSDHSFELARWVNLQGKNGYIINGMNANFQEVKEYLKERGLDLKIRHNIIAQQMITEFASLKAKGNGADDIGFCEIFERAIGINHRDPLKYALQKTIRKREGEARIQMEKIDLLFKQLDRMAPKLNEDLSLVNIRSRASLLGYFESASDLIKIKNMVKKEELPLNQLEEEITKIQLAKKKAIQEQHQEEGAYKDLVTQSQEKEEEIFEMQGKLQKYSNGMKKLQEMLTQREELKQEKEKQVENLSHNLEALEEKEDLKLKKIMLKDLSNQLIVFQNQQEVLKQEKAECEASASKKVKPIDNRIGEINRELGEAKDKILHLSNDLEYVLQQLDRANLRKEEELGEVLQKQEKLKRVVQEQQMITEEIKRIQQQRAKGKKLVDPIVEETQVVRSKIFEVQRDLMRVRDQIKQIQEAEAVNSGEDPVHQLLKKANIATYAGRLDMLGSIDAKYKVAALASGRGKLKSYIVEKIDDMK